MKDLKQKYAEMFISMGTDFLMGRISWRTFVSNTEIAAKAMLSVEAPSKDAHCEQETRKEDGP